MPTLRKDDFGPTPSNRATRADFCVGQCTPPLTTQARLHITRIMYSRPKTVRADLLLMTTYAISHAHNARTKSRASCTRIIDRDFMAESSVHTKPVPEPTQNGAGAPFCVRRQEGFSQLT